MVKMNLADIHRKRGAYEQAQQLYREALAQLEASLGAEHPEVGEALNCIGMLHKKLASYAEAEEAYQRALEIFTKSYGPAHPKVGIVLNNLGDVRRYIPVVDPEASPPDDVLNRKQRSTESAQQYYARALKILTTTLGKDNSETAEVLANMGLLARDVGDISEAQRLTRQALAVFEKVQCSSLDRSSLTPSRSSVPRTTRWA